MAQATKSTSSAPWPLPRILLPTTTDYHKNQDRIKSGQSPCGVCGRGIDMSRYDIHFVYTVDGSDLCSKREMEENAGWEMPIGNDCWKKHPEIHEYESESLRGDEKLPKAA